MESKYKLEKKVDMAEFGLLSRGKGAILWTYYIEDEDMTVTNIKGHDYHLFAVKGTRTDKIWRGRVTKEKYGIVTVLPPLKAYTNGNLELPEELIYELIAEFEPEKVLVDTGSGVRRLINKGK